MKHGFMYAKSQRLTMKQKNFGSQVAPKHIACGRHVKACKENRQQRSLESTNPLFGLPKSKSTSSGVPKSKSSVSPWAADALTVRQADAEWKQHCYD